MVLRQLMGIWRDLRFIRQADRAKLLAEREQLVELLQLQVAHAEPWRPGRLQQTDQSPCPAGQAGGADQDAGGEGRAG